MRPESLRALGLGIFLVGALLLILGVIYFLVPVGSLPSVLGHIANGTDHHTKRGLTAIVVGVVCLLASPVVLRRAAVRKRAMRFQRYR